MEDPFPGAELGSPEARQIAELQQALRASLSDLASGVGEIRSQLVAGVGEVRAGEEPRSLGLALRNLEGFYALLTQIGESFPERPLPALDRLDAQVNRGLTRLDGAEGAAALAEGIETALLPALEGWPQVVSELAAAIGALAPELFETTP